jgi:hypothetical protein
MHFLTKEDALAKKNLVHVRDRRPTTPGAEARYPSIGITPQLLMIEDDVTPAFSRVPTLDGEDEGAITDTGAIQAWGSRMIVLR